MSAQTSIPKLLELMKAAKPTNEQERIALQQGARELSFRTEDSLESINRIIYSPVVLSFHKIGVDLGLFAKLVEAGKPVTAAELAHNIEADPVLVNRILRYLATHASLDQVDATHYQANAITRTLANENFAAAIDHSARFHAKLHIELPEYLAQHHYVNPSNPNDTAAMKAMGTTLPMFEWGMTQPLLTSLFMKFMSVSYRSYESWSSGLDIRELCKGSTAETPLFVDIGGSIGHQCVDFRTRHPDIPGRVILQDQPFIMKHSIPFESVEKQPTDFWKPQQVKGARIYYMRMILHDYPDDKCVELLKLTKAAMGPDSVIAIDEICLPEANPHWRAATMDVNMLATLAALERTESEWAALLPKAGLKIKQIQKYVFDTAASIIVAVPE